MKKDAIIEDLNVNSSEPEVKEEKVDNRIGTVRSKIATVVMILPYILSFSVFIVLPVILAITMTIHCMLKQIPAVLMLD